MTGARCQKSAAEHQSQAVKGHHSHPPLLQFWELLRLALECVIPAAVHPEWLSWQQAPAVSGHPGYRMLMPRSALMTICCPLHQQLLPDLHRALPQLALLQTVVWAALFCLL